MDLVATKDGGVSGRGAIAPGLSAEDAVALARKKRTASSLESGVDPHRTLLCLGWLSHRRASHSSTATAMASGVSRGSELSLRNSASHPAIVMSGIGCGVNIEANMLAVGFMHSPDSGFATTANPE